MASSQRIELMEKVEVPLSDNDKALRRMGISVPRKFTYERINPLLSEITPQEIEGVENECMIKFKGGYKCIVKIPYDELCIKINDLENNYVEGEDE